MIIGLGIGIPFFTRRGTAAIIAANLHSILIEDGNRLLLENGNIILLESMYA
jgi:hypothetical protein